MRACNGLSAALAAAEASHVIAREVQPHAETVRQPRAQAATPEHVRRLLAEASAVTSTVAGGQVEVQLGHFCNNRCVFCASGQMSEQGVALPVADPEVVRALDAAAAQGIHRVTFLGGEPTIQDSFLPSLAHARKLGMNDITVFTNGSRTWDARFLDSVLAHGPVQWRVSVQGGTAAAHDAIVGKKGAFARILRGLQLLRARGQDVTVNMCLTSAALPDLPRLAELVVAHGVRQLCIDMVRTVSAGERSEAWLRSIMPRFADMVPQLRALVAELDRIAPNFDVNLTHLPFCLMPEAAHRVHHGGEPTVTFTADQRHEQGAMDKYAFQASDRRLMPACAACVFRPRCTGVAHVYLDWHGEAEFQPVREADLPRLDPQQHAFCDEMRHAVVDLQAREPEVQAMVADTHQGNIQLRTPHAVAWLVPAATPAPVGLWPVAVADRWQLAVQPGLVSAAGLSSAHGLARAMQGQAAILSVDWQRGAFCIRWLRAAIAVLRAQPDREVQLLAADWRWAAVTLTLRHRAGEARVRLAPADDARRPLQIETLASQGLAEGELAHISQWLGRVLRAARPRA